MTAAELLKHLQGENTENSQLLITFRRACSGVAGEEWAAIEEWWRTFPRWSFVERGT